MRGKGTEKKKNDYVCFVMTCIRVRTSLRSLPERYLLLPVACASLLGPCKKQEQCSFPQECAFQRRKNGIVGAPSRCKTCLDPPFIHPAARPPSPPPVRLVSFPLCSDPLKVSSPGENKEHSDRLLFLKCKRLIAEKTHPPLSNSDVPLVKRSDPSP